MGIKARAFTIKSFDETRNTHTVIANDGVYPMQFVVDLFCDASFDGNPVKDGCSIEEYLKECKDLVGKKITIDNLQPCEHFACGVKLIK